MPRTIADARLELDRLSAMYRALPDQRDSAAVQMAKRIRRVQNEIEELEAGPGKKASSGGFSVTTVILAVLVFGAFAFSVAYVGITLMER